MNAQQLILYATNEAKLYETHKNLAINECQPIEWLFHIRNAVLPLYRKEFNEPWEGMTRADLEEAADQLSDYYAEHLKECQEIEPKPEPEYPGEAVPKGKPERRGVYSKA